MSQRKNRFLPLSLRGRFLIATSVVVTVLSLAYGIVAVIGYSLSFDKTTFRLLRGQSNLFYTLASWDNNRLTVKVPDSFDVQTTTITLIYDEKGKLLWAQRNIPAVIKQIKPKWLLRTGFQALDASYSTTSALIGSDPVLQRQLRDFQDGDDDNDNDLTHSIAVNLYPATAEKPALTFVVIDTIPTELKHSNVVWEWFVYVVMANLLLVGPLLWLAAWWSLRPIEALTREVRELETHDRQALNPKTTRELSSLVINLNRLLKTERERYEKYRTTLTDLTHSLKTPLAVLQSTLRSLRTQKIDVDQAEPVMLEQISRISQQIGYYLHRASMRSGHELLSREVHSAAALIDSLISALNKVYQRKGVVITLDISPELVFIGNNNDFLEVVGNILDNACKYCLEFVEITARHNDEALHLIIDDDGPGIPEVRRNEVFDRGKRADTLRPGQGIGLSVAREIVEQYDGQITTTDGPLGGTRMEVIFAHQDSYADSNALKHG